MESSTRCGGAYGTRCATQPEEEPLLSEREEIRDQDGEREEEGLRRRVLSSQGSEIRRTQEEEEQTRSRDGRMVSQEELIAEVRRAMRGEVVEPGGEPGTMREDIAGAVAVAEEVQHPADWDPETHGEIPCGKGEPPAAYFQRQRSKGKGPRPTWVVETGDGWRWQYYDPAKGAGERAGKGMPSSHGGGEPSSSKGGHGEGSERSSEAGGEAGSVNGKGSVTSISHRGASTVGGAGHGGDVGPFPFGTNERGPIYVTEYGEKYHVNVRCQSLRRTRRLIVSAWCEDCSNPMPGLPVALYCHGPGQDAHSYHMCQAAGGARRYERCGLCRRD